MRRLVLSLVLACAVIAACGSPAGQEQAAAPSAPGFPITVEHEFGTTTVPAPPLRVVTAGYTEQDVVLALGIKPVGVTEWYGEHPYATWPWAQDELGDAKPEVLRNADELEYEKIAKLDPDLIIAVNAGTDQGRYDRLTAIAPTIAQPKGAVDWFSPWDTQTLQIGKALGKEREATALVTGIKERFAEASKAHPQFAGQPAIFLQAPYYEGKAIAYQNGLSTAFLTDLGFTVPQELAAFAPPDAATQAYIPLEQLGTLNVGKVLVWATENDQVRTELEAQPIYRELTPVKQGNLVFTDGELAGAIYFTTPLSLPYVLDRLVPLLEKAVAGNPETIPAAR
ncbi:ABC transporter substrate-binding protein [Pseudonocardia sp. TRM90224]|uniref:ABC transporter substrate-binding protein n=1 Tax=Pseudonocardia sp. TRM90224 TaxID=2812678 RepID=UPI001E407132|nr:ABC transporter substrate-binding protein [Pseudonocardia sp. TRM90224]